MQRNKKDPDVADHRVRLHNRSRLDPVKDNNHTNLDWKAGFLVNPVEELSTSRVLLEPRIILTRRIVGRNRHASFEANDHGNWRHLRTVNRRDRCFRSRRTSVYRVPLDHHPLVNGCQAKEHCPRFALSRLVLGDWQPTRARGRNTYTHLQHKTTEKWITRCSHIIHTKWGPDTVNRCHSLTAETLRAPSYVSSFFKLFITIA